MLLGHVDRDAGSARPSGTARIEVLRHRVGPETPAQSARHSRPDRANRATIEAILLRPELHPSGDSVLEWRDRRHELGPRDLMQVRLNVKRARRLFRSSSWPGLL